MFLFLGLGFIIGMRHALEADHLAAVVAMSTRATGRLETIVRGAAWGAGHTTSLLVLGGVCLALGATIPPDLEVWLERGVGMMLIALGAAVLVRLRRSRVHVHVHRHDGGVVHAHAHRHAATELDPARHNHQQGHAHPHASRSHIRAWMVGLVHGLAGTAALLVLTASSAPTFWSGMSYIGVFGLGSVAGMAVLSAVIAVPLRLSARRFTRGFGALEAAVALGTMAVGLLML